MVPSIERRHMSLTLNATFVVLESCHRAACAHNRSITDMRQAAIGEEEKLPWYLVRPDTGWHIAWDLTILGLVCYFSLLVPVRVGFDIIDGARRESFYAVLQVCVLPHVMASDVSRYFSTPC